MIPWLLPTVAAVLLLPVQPASAQAPRLLAPQEQLAAGDVISLVNLAPSVAGTVLEGRTDTEDLGALGLATSGAPADNSIRWRVHELAPASFSFECLGFPDAPSWLDGTTRNGRVLLRLGPHGVSGASWALYHVGNAWRLRCLGSVPGARWLAALQGIPALALEEETSGTLWQILVWRKAPAALTPLR